MSDMSTSHVPHRITVEEYRRMADAGIFAPDARPELIDGALIEPVAPMKAPHASAVMTANRLWTIALADVAIVRCQLPITLGDASEPEPDLAIVRRPSSLYRERHPIATDVFAIVEVSDTSRMFDLTRKVPMYAAHAIPRGVDRRRDRPVSARLSRSGRKRIPRTNRNRARSVVRIRRFPRHRARPQRRPLTRVARAAPFASQARKRSSANPKRVSSLERDARWPGGWQPITYAERCARRKAELASDLERFLTYCRTRDDIAAVYVFGSYARDAISPWSDIDVLVVRDAPADASRRELVEDLYCEGRLYGDIVTVPTSRYPDGLRATPFGRTMLAEGICVHARPPR